MRLLSLTLILTLVPARAQTVKLIPSCGQAGTTKICVTGSGWAEPQPPCRYVFFLDANNVAPDQQDGLFGPPATSFVIPAATPNGDRTVLVQLRNNSPDALLQTGTATLTVAAPGTAASATTAVAGGGITLTYNPPNPSCVSTCKRIVWIQVVRRFVVKQGDTDAQAVITSVTDWPGFPDQANKQRDETGAGARVDRIWGRNFPYYGVDNTGVTAAGTSNAGGTMTPGKTGSPPVAATMFDAPDTPAPFFPVSIGGVAANVVKAILRFEAAPFCLDGDQAGTFLGQVVTWESHQTKGGTAAVQNAATSASPPSATFTTALSQWVGGNVSSAGPPPVYARNPFNLPQPVPVPCP